MRQEIAEVQSANRETENRLRMEQERTQKLTSEKAKTEMALERNRVDLDVLAVGSTSRTSHRIIAFGYRSVVRLNIDA